MKKEKFITFFFKEVFSMNSDNLVKENIIYNDKEKKKLKIYIQNKL